MGKAGGKSCGIEQECVEWDGEGEYKKVTAAGTAPRSAWR